jgi:hypothetical protein
MLQSISRERPLASLRLILHRVILVNIDPELAVYLSKALRREWSKILVLQQPLLNAYDRCDLAIFVHEPPPSPSTRCLWLSDLTRHFAVHLLDHNRWRSPLPLNAHELIRGIFKIFSA